MGSISLLSNCGQTIYGTGDLTGPGLEPETLAFWYKRSATWYMYVKLIGWTISEGRQTQFKLILNLRE